MELANTATINNASNQGEAVQDQETSQGLTNPLLAVIAGYLNHPAFEAARMLLVETLVGRATLAPPVPPKTIPIEYGPSGVVLQPSFVINNPSLTVNDLIKHIENHSPGFGSIKVFIREGKKRLNKSSFIVDILTMYPNPVIDFVRHIAHAGVPFFINRGEELEQAVILGRSQTRMTIKFDDGIDPFKELTAGYLYSLKNNEYFQECVYIQNMNDRDPDETFLEIKKDESYFIEIVRVTDDRITFRAHYLKCALSKLEILDEDDIDVEKSAYKEYITEKDRYTTTFHLPCALDRIKCYLEITIHSIEIWTRFGDVMDFSVVDRETNETAKCLWIYSMDGKKILNIRKLLNITYKTDELDDGGHYDEGVTITLK
jgi:hypothetical protein